MTEGVLLASSRCRNHNACSTGEEHEEQERESKLCRSAETPHRKAVYGLLRSHCSASTFHQPFIMNV
ncbi:hypothetical protein ACFXTN_024727 [Malus domestica]